MTRADLSLFFFTIFFLKNHHLTFGSQASNFAICFTFLFIELSQSRITGYGLVKLTWVFSLMFFFQFPYLTLSYLLLNFVIFFFCSIILGNELVKLT